MWLSGALKVILTSAFVCYASASRTFEPPTTQIDGDRTDQLMTAVADHINYGDELKTIISFMATDMLAFDHFKYNQMASYFGGAIKAKLQVTNPIFRCNFGLYKAVSDVRTDSLDHQWSQLHITHPLCFFSGDYDVDGEVLGQHVSGKGHYTFMATNVSLSFHDVTLRETDSKAMRLESLGFDLDADDLRFLAEGLTVDDMDTLEFQELLAAAVLESFESLGSRYNYKGEVKSKGEIAVFNAVSKFVNRYSLDYSLKWLKDHTPDFAEEEKTEEGEEPEAGENEEEEE